MAKKDNALLDENKGATRLYLGNEAIVRGALEAGVAVAAAYPGTPSSEIIENFSKIAKDRNMYVEWSVNEKVAVEVAAAASFAGLRSITSMKQNGVNVASDFILHLAYSGLRAGMVIVPCEDPGALSSQNEGESRHFAHLHEIPCLEPADFQEAKDMTKWAFELSEEIRSLVMVRSLTRLSHASGNVVLGELPKVNHKAHFRFDGPVLDNMTGPIHSMPAHLWHARLQEKMKKVTEIFEESPYNIYTGPDKPELIIITSSMASLYAKEAVHMLGLKDRVGILKIGTSWPLPPKLIKKYLAKADKIMFVEEVLPFLEEHTKIIAADAAKEVGIKTFYGKHDGSIPMSNELNPDLVIAPLAKIFGISYEAVPFEYAWNVQTDAQKNVPPRQMTFCPGCPHRASFWSIHNAIAMDNREGFMCGDVGCYGMALIGAGFFTTKSAYAMGSGTGLASGFGKMKMFGMDQPSMAVCGDSTFFHAVMPALANAIHNKSDITLVVLDNSGTAMTGFQPHPGLTIDAMGANDMPAISIPDVCRAMGAKVQVCDPFDLKATHTAVMKFLEDREGAKVLVLKQVCALSPEKRGKKVYNMDVDSSVCLSDTCGCNRLCTRIFRCPGLRWDPKAKKTSIDPVLCSGCGVCADICPSGAIKRVKVSEVA